MTDWNVRFARMADDMLAVNGGEAPRILVLASMLAVLDDLTSEEFIQAKRALIGEKVA